MPVYVYEVIRDDAADGLPGHRFEVIQQMSDAALTKHPITGQPVKRIIQRIEMAGKYTDIKGKNMMDEKNLARNGFAKYIKVDDDTYERMTGDGPKRLSSKDLPQQ